MKESLRKKPSLIERFSQRFRKKDLAGELQAETRMQIVNTMLIGIRGMEEEKGTEDYERGGLSLDSAARAAERNGWDAYAALDIAYHLRTLELQSAKDPLTSK